MHARRRGLAVFLTALSALGPLSTDLYLPSFPAIAAELETTQASVQLTLGLFIAGFAVMQLLSGPMSDRWGRKPVLLGGMLVFLFASLACAAARSIEWLLLARFVQAVGACAGPVVARAIVRDLFPQREAGRMLGYVASAMAIAPIIAPTIGGYLQLWFGWEACFLALAAAAACMLPWIAFGFSESLAENVPEATDPRPLWRRWRMLLRDRLYLAYTLSAALIFGGLFGWISNAASVVMERFGIAPHRFGLLFGIVILGFSAGAFTGGRLVTWLDVPRTVLSGMAACVAAGLAMSVVSWAGLLSLPVLIVLQMLYLFGCGMVVPQATAGAMGPHPSIAGIASALLGFVQMSTGFVSNALSSALFDGTERALLGLDLGFAVLGLAAFLLLLRPAARPSPGRFT